eukprot:CAMPEP_0181064308 /NCGR_PEP_ID=MMETSP1070-20121207/24134_1 /TAXON_ID=265543 /ORGANISM="Minutocellus polymorphus, Strain NH13" /LENGTH=730 /DNA_ID=CAMNT_0023144619 /DNA_START=183 /DNA_END=2375 /DNA_ORIENTATION=-
MYRKPSGSGLHRRDPYGGSNGNGKGHVTTDVTTAGAVAGTGTGATMAQRMPLQHRSFPSAQGAMMTAGGGPGGSSGVAGGPQTSFKRRNPYAPMSSGGGGTTPQAPSSTKGHPMPPPGPPPRGMARGHNVTRKSHSYASPAAPAPLATSRSMWAQQQQQTQQSQQAHQHQQSHNNYAQAYPPAAGSAAALPSHFSHPLHAAQETRASRHPGGVPGGDGLDTDHGHSKGGGMMAGGQNQFSQPQGLTQAAMSDLAVQGRKILTWLAGAPPKSQYGEDDMYDDETQRAVAKLYQRVLILVPLLLGIIYGGPTSLDWATRPKKWGWTPQRALDGRRCVMNLYVEKQPQDEFNPDFVEIKPGEKNKDGTPKVPTPPKIVEGTYRTKGQVHVISRFIEAVADSFRPNINTRQHVIFAGSRDSGHLAEVATKHWPPRGSFRTQFHVIADDINPDESEEALGYGTISAIEERFRGKENIHVYDREGSLAGLKSMDDDADDDEIMDDDFREGYTERKNQLDRRRAKMLGMEEDADPFGNSTARPPYMSLTSLLPIDEDEDEESGLIIPYLHVDGIDQEEQFSILDSAKPLLLTNTIVVVGVEHSPDLDLRALIEFFLSVNYKTFILGSRQVHRADNLCPEILDDVLLHPALNKRTLSPHPIRSFLHKIGIVKDDMSHLKQVPDDTRLATPPYFVAMPRGRRSKEEMTIQHMYDLFGGYGGGGGQIKTANDRKAPGKKK